MTDKDYYKILGVDKSATKEEIKKAYKNLAKQHHPDISKDPGATEKFKEINEAAAVLGDDDKRSQYDQYGKTYEQFKGGRGFDFNDFGFNFQDLGGFGFEDIFDRFFGGGFSGGRTKRGPRRGSDLRYDIEITLEEAYHGATKTVIIPRLEKCSKCKGSGANSEDDIVTCPECNGAGAVRRVQRTPFGMVQTQSVCHKCQGSGKFIKNECSVCDGTGVEKKTRQIEIKIPAGAEEGTNLRIAGQGEAGEKGGGTGDLYIFIHIEEHKVFDREEDDIKIRVPIKFSTAVLGEEIDVPTLDGTATLKIPSGTDSGTVFRIRSRGMPHLHGHGSGDQYVEVFIEVPKKVSKKQKELIKEFEKEKKGLFR
ncbi:MAG: molecular chaperone DnaJ [Nanoarchaeota archaeon]|nr:molecular chaperone DnaJ [Nanoarchaeota archaeon]